jgi:hypothetical protein
MGFLMLTDRHGFQNIVSDNNESFYRSYNIKVPESMRWKIQAFDTKEAAKAALTGGKQKVSPVAKGAAKTIKSKGK